MHLKISIKFLAKMVILISILISLDAFAVDLSLQNQINAMIIKNNSNMNVQTHERESKNRFAFILFYMSTCQHCQRFDPILKEFSSENHIPVLAYTLDGNSLPSFPNSFTPTKNELLKFFPTGNPVVPTLFLMDQKTHRIYPMLRGEATQDQLSQRFAQVRSDIFKTKINTISEQDFGS